MPYYSERQEPITQNPRITRATGIIEFINQFCVFSPGSAMPTEEIYDRYVRFCNDTIGPAPVSFNVFARSFKYYVYHNNMVIGVDYHPINYYHDTPDRGIIRKQGWGYINLAVNY